MREFTSYGGQRAHGRQGGFTLVEIAIVLVIVGLLLGGILKGQELINSAQVKSFSGDFRSASTYINGYQDRFRAVSYTHLTLPTKRIV